MEIILFTDPNRNSTPIGCATIQFGEVLLFPQNKIQLVAKVFFLECDCHSHGIDEHINCKFKVKKKRHLGNLSMWFRLTCELEVLKKFGTHFWLFENQMPGDTGAKDYSNAMQRGNNDVLAIAEATHMKTVEKSFIILKFEFIHLFLLCFFAYR